MKLKQIFILVLGSWVGGVRAPQEGASEDIGMESVTNASPSGSESIFPVEERISHPTCASQMGYFQEIDSKMREWGMWGHRYAAFIRDLKSKHNGRYLFDQAKYIHATLNQAMQFAIDTIEESVKKLQKEDINRWFYLIKEWNSQLAELRNAQKQIPTLTHTLNELTNAAAEGLGRDMHKIVACYLKSNPLGKRDLVASGDYIKARIQMDSALRRTIAGLEKEKEELKAKLVRAEMEAQLLEGETSFLKSSLQNAQEQVSTLMEQNRESIEQARKADVERLRCLQELMEVKRISKEGIRLKEQTYRLEIELAQKTADSTKLVEELQNSQEEMHRLRSVRENAMDSLKKRLTLMENYCADLTKELAEKKDNSRDLSGKLEQALAELAKTKSDGATKLVRERMISGHLAARLREVEAEAASLREALQEEREVNMYAVAQFVQPDMAESIARRLVEMYSMLNPEMVLNAFGV